MKKYLLTLTLAASLFTPAVVTADSGCSSAYGSSVYGVNCTSENIVVNKTVQNPVTGEFVDNLGSNASHFLPNQNVNFRIRVENTGNTDLSNVQVEDRLPDFVDFVSGPGNFNKDNKHLNFTIDSLKAGEFREYNVIAKVMASDKLTNGVTCVSNFAQATVNNMFNSDTAVFCIESQVLAPVQELPKTGPASTSLIIFGSAALLVTSMLLFKKARA